MPAIPSEEEETTAEFDSETLAKEHTAQHMKMPTKEADIVWAARTDIGRVRDHNEDKFDFFLPDEPHLLATRGRLWAVADGMGGHEGGQIASEATLKALVRGYFSDRTIATVESALQEALTYGNGIIWQASKQMGGDRMMGTTVVAAVVIDDKLTIAHIGDSRAYLLRKDEPLRQMTADHSWVEEQIKRGGMTREQAEKSPHRNVITRSVGMGDSVKADFSTVVLQEGDTVLLCSDGLSGFIKEEAIHQILKTTTPAQAALNLIDAANESGGGDNITALILSVRAVRPYSVIPDSS